MAGNHPQRSAHDRLCQLAYRSRYVADLFGRIAACLKAPR